MPTPWLVTAAGGALLALTAAFGGLNEVPDTPPAELGVGETFVGSDLSMTVLGVALTDTRPMSGLIVDEQAGERVLSVILEVVNEFDLPRVAESPGVAASPVIDGITVVGVTSTQPQLSRDGEGYAPITLQPGVPVRIAASWILTDDSVQPGDELPITLPGATHGVGQQHVTASRRSARALRAAQFCMISTMTIVAPAPASSARPEAMMATMLIHRGPGRRSARMPSTRPITAIPTPTNGNSPVKNAIPPKMIARTDRKLTPAFGSGPPGYTTPPGYCAPGYCAPGYCAPGYCAPGY